MLDQVIIPACGCDDGMVQTELLDVASAVSLATSLVSPIARCETVPLPQALSRVCAEDILAPRAMPPFDNSAMDGFALRCEDIDLSPSLSIAGTIAAGESPGTLPQNSAVRIFTGAPVPRGADAVVMVERTQEVDGVVHIDAQPSPGENIRVAGSDQAPNAVLLRAGQRIAAHHIGLLAAQNITEVAVAARPRVGVFSTGNELHENAVSEARIFDANRPMLLVLAEAAGAEAVDLGILPDDPDATAEALRAVASAFDLVLTSGAVSMGGKDHILASVTRAGGEVHGWRVAIKPGKPALFAVLGTAALTGLPGNPFAAYVGFHLFVAPQIARLLGVPRRKFATVPALAGFNWSRKPGRAEVFPVCLDNYDALGRPVLERLGRSVSATLLPMSEANGLAFVPGTTAIVRPGDPLMWQPFDQTGVRI